jgi:polysaccharide export outer membrane protein
MSNRSPSTGSWPYIFAVCAVLALGPTWAQQLAGSSVHHLATLGPGDTIAVQVYGQPDMSSTVYVGDDGTVSLPLVDKVQVKGLSPLQAATSIEEALKAGQYLVDPHVTVTVVSSRSQRVSVLGEVGKAGPYPLESESSVFDVLALAGGLTDNSADVAFVVHRDEAGNETRTPFNPRPSAASLGTQKPIPKLQSGDSIYVPRAEHFYIYGEVATPSMYRIEKGMTVIQAIARAGGVTPRGSERRVQIKRTDANGHDTVIGAKPGDLVQPNDVIRVKESIF